MNDYVLQLKNVSRLFPKDVSETGTSLYREMILPRSMFKSHSIDYFYAVEKINISIKKNEKIGILGTHLSGKSTLAGILSGMIEPTGGSIISYGSRHLINGKSSAGYKPMLKIIENLRLQAMFLGLQGDELEHAIENTLEKARLDYSDLLKTTGNVSKRLIRQIALIMSLQINSDIIIVDNINSTGTGIVREDIVEYINNKIASSTSLIVASHPKLIQQTTNKIFLLHYGRLYGPFDFEEAIAHYSELPRENHNEMYVPSKPPKRKNIDDNFLSDDHILDNEDDSDNESYPIDPWIKKFTLREKKFQERGKLDEFIKKAKEDNRPLLDIDKAYIDGKEYFYRSISLVRKRNDILSLQINFIVKMNFNLSGFVITLHPEHEDEIMRADLPLEERDLKFNSSHKLMLDVEIPDLKPYRYILTITPIQKNKAFLIKNRIKLVKFGILGHGIIRRYGKMKLKLNSFT
jgi:ABC-2 type transport system ATP-binding protein